MVSWFIRSVIQCCLFLAAASMSSAQEPCATDCNLTTSPYTQQVVAIAVSQGCAVTLTIRTRVCSGIFEVEVVAATFSPGCANNADPRVAIEAAIRQYVTSNGMQFPTGSASNTSQQQWMWRVSRPACWSVNSLQGTAQACGLDCCISYLTVTRKLNCPDWSITREIQRNTARGCALATRQSQEVDSGTADPCASACSPIVPGLK